MQAARGRAGHMMLATSYDSIQLKRRRVYIMEDDLAGIICEALARGFH